MESRIQDCLDFPYMGRNLATSYFKFVLCISTTLLRIRPYPHPYSLWSILSFQGGVIFFYMSKRKIWMFFIVPEIH